MTDLAKVSVAVVVMFWLLEGIAAGLIAQAKGDDFGFYFVIGIILGPIGIIIALTRKRVIPAGWHEDEDGETRYWDGVEWTDDVPPRGRSEHRIPD